MRQVCSVDGCRRPVRSKGLCNMHYQRWWKHGDATHEAPTYDTCTVDGCQNKTRSVMSPYCEKHYMRIRRNGTTDTVIDTTQYERCLYCDRLLPEGVNRYCNTTCEARKRRGTPLRRTCKVCNTEFYPRHNKVYCSEECDAEAARERGRELHQKYYKSITRPTLGIALHCAQPTTGVGYE